MISAISASVSNTPMGRVRQELERLRLSPRTPALLVGPPGAGKHHTAALLHRLSFGGTDRAPFVEVDCAALPREQLESALLGHERGAFADATIARRGLLEQANGGSLLFHEITALPRAAQGLLLKFLDGMRLRRLGAERELALSLRVLATASHDPRELVESGHLLEELYRRLAVVRLDVPPLKARKDEIFGLCQRFVEEFAARSNKQVSGLSEEAQSLLGAYAFPGNVRELRGIIERAVVAAQGPLLSAKDLELGDGHWRAPPLPERFFEVDASHDGVPLPLDAVEQAYVRRVLEHTGGKRMAAAQLLGISYPTFLKRLRELGLDKSDSGIHAAASAPGSSRVGRAL